MKTLYRRFVANLNKYTRVVFMKRGDNVEILVFNRIVSISLSRNSVHLYTTKKDGNTVPKNVLGGPIYTTPDTQPIKTPSHRHQSHIVTTANQILSLCLKRTPSNMYGKTRNCV